MAKDKKSPNAAKAVVQDMLPSAALWTSERRHKEDVGSIDANPRSEGCHPDDVDTAPSMRADPPATADGGAPGQPGKSDASPTSDAESGGKESVVNDCKGELWQSTAEVSEPITDYWEAEPECEPITDYWKAEAEPECEPITDYWKAEAEPECEPITDFWRGEEVKAEEFSSFPQEYTMTVDKLERLVNLIEPVGYQQPVRDAIRLIRHHALPVSVFLASDEIELVKRIESYRSDMTQRREEGADPKDCFVSAAMDNPAKLAGRIRRALHNCSIQFAKIGFPTVAAPGDRSLHPYSAWDEGAPPVIRTQIETDWKPQIKGEPLGTGMGDPIVPKTIAEYRTKALQVVTLAVLAGLEINPDFDIEFLTEPETVSLWLPLLFGHYRGSKSHAPIIAAIKRVTEDLLTANHPNVEGLAAIQRRATKDPGLPAVQVEKARDMTRGDGTSGTIWSIPEQIDKRASAARLRPADRNSRKSSAVAAEILLCTVAFAPLHIASLNLETNIRGAGEHREVLCTARDGSQQWCKLTSKACKRIDDLLQYRRVLRLPSPWLFPATNGNRPQERRVAMNALASNIGAVLGRRLRTVDIRDTLVTNGIDHGLEDTKLGADATAMTPRAYERRFNIPLQTPMPPAEGGA